MPFGEEDEKKSAFLAWKIFLLLFEAVYFSVTVVFYATQGCGKKKRPGIANTHSTSNVTTIQSQIDTEHDLSSLKRKSKYKRSDKTEKEQSREEVNDETLDVSMYLPTVDDITTSQYTINDETESHQSRKGPTSNIQKKATPDQTKSLEESTIALLGVKYLESDICAAKDSSRKKMKGSGNAIISKPGGKSFQGKYAPKSPNLEMKEGEKKTSK